MGRIVLIVPLLGLAAGAWSLLADGNMMVLFVLFGAAVLALLLFGLLGSRGVDRRERESAHIESHIDRIRNERITLLGQLGKPAANGDWDRHQKGVWKQIEALEQEEKQFKASTEVVNLDPLGHNIGRTWRK